MTVILTRLLSLGLLDIFPIRTSKGESSEQAACSTAKVLDEFIKEVTGDMKRITTGGQGA